MIEFSFMAMRPEAPVSIIPVPFFEGVRTFVNADPKKKEELLLDAVIPVLIDGADRILSQVPIQWEPGAKEAYISAKRQGYSTANIYDHQTWLDALEAAQVAEAQQVLEAEHGVSQRTKGNLITLAKSVETGHQGSLLQKGYLEMKRHFTRRGTQTIGYVRVPEDVDDYGLEPNRVEVTKKLLKAVEEDKSLSFFPEGSVEGGRTKLAENEIENDLSEFLVPGKINGMQRFDGDVFDQAKRIIEKRGKKAVFVPVAIDGIYHLLKPKNNRKLRATLTMRSLLALGTPFDLGLITVNVGMPLRVDTILEDLRRRGREENGQNIADFVGYRVARMLPEKARGVYAQAA